jgi:hypothetical protein
VLLSLAKHRCAISQPKFCARLMMLVICLLGGMTTSHVLASSLELVVDYDTGETYFKNPTGSSETLDGYTITSPDGGLLTGSWTPVAGNYDLSGDQSVDTVSDWFVISSTPMSVTDVSLTAFSGALASDQVVSLGFLWDTGSADNLSAVTSAGVTTMNIDAEFRILFADYNGDLEIDQEDYDLFVDTFGSTIDLRADGNQNGVVDASDYTIWRDFMETMSPIEEEVMLANPLVALATSPITAIPEPHAILLVGISIGSYLLRRRTTSQ